jgi:hypothetical protein
MFAVPASARTSCWLNAWLAGRVPADDVIGGICAGGSAEFLFERGDEPLPAALLLAELRRLGATGVSVALPLPGHPIGLGGPAPFNQAAIDSGQAIIVHGTARGFVPLTVGSSTRWRGSAAEPPSFLPDVATADRDLRDALRDATERLVELDITSWSPDAADAIMNLRAPTRLDRELPFASPRAAQTAVSGLRAAAIVALAERHESGPVSAADMANRHEALQPLHIAARQAVVAGCSVGGPH